MKRGAMIGGEALNWEVEVLTNRSCCPPWGHPSPSGTSLWSLVKQKTYSGVGLALSNVLERLEKTGSHTRFRVLIVPAHGKINKAMSEWTFLE